VNNGVGPQTSYGLMKRVGVAEIEFAEAKIPHLAHLLEVRVLGGGRVKVVEIVDNGELKTATQKGFGDVRANEACSSGQQHMIGPWGHACEAFRANQSWFDSGERLATLPGSEVFMLILPGVKTEILAHLCRACAPVRVPVHAPVHPHKMDHEVCVRERFHSIRPDQ
jgi:hypothetical protein